MSNAFNIPDDEVDEDLEAKIYNFYEKSDEEIDQLVSETIENYLYTKYAYDKLDDVLVEKIEADFAENFPSFLNTKVIKGDDVIHVLFEILFDENEREYTLTIR